MAAQKSGEQLANGLGWFSIGLGLAELAVPGKLAEFIGIRNDSANRRLLRIYGARELTAGIGILSQPSAAGWLWGRVAGDAVDLASLGTALTSDTSERARVGMATAAVAGVTALDVLCAQQLSRGGKSSSSRSNGTRHVTRSVTINKSPGEVYRFWRDFNNLSTFMQHLESVQVIGDRRSIWRANAPAGKTIQWQAEIVSDEPDSLISWRSIEGSDIDNSGTVHFQTAPGGRGTVVRVDLQYSLPGGAVTANLAKLFNSEPGQQVADDLRILKQVLETGEVTKSDASIHRGMHPGRPPARAATA